MRRLASQTIVVYGGGGHGRVVAEAAEAAGWTVVGFFDDALSEKQPVDRWVVIAWPNVPRDAGVIVGIGDNASRDRISQRMIRQGRRLATIIHPSASISPSAKIGRGVYIGAHAVVNAGARIAEGVIVNSAAVVEHDCRVGKYSHVGPRAALGGDVTVGKQTLIGIGGTVRPGIKIGDGCVVGAGAVVVADVPAARTVVGVPARIRR